MLCSSERPQLGDGDSEHFAGSSRAEHVFVGISSPEGHGASNVLVEASKKTQGV